MTSVPLWSQFVHVPTQREWQWLVVAILSWLLWRPIRVTINHWRLHRRQRKYPQLVVCRIDKAPSNGQRRSPSAGSGMLQNFMMTMLHTSVTVLLVQPLKCIKFVMNMWTSYRPTPPSTSAAPLSEPSSTPTPPPTRTSPPLSVLRKAGSSAPSSSVHSRVEFAEHSNGHVRTERRYYLPHAQPNQSIQPPTTPSPPPVQYSRRSEHETMFLTPEWPSGRPNPKRQLVPTHSQKSTNADDPTSRRDDSRSLALKGTGSSHSSTPTRLIVQTPLSQQMRKRQLDEPMDQLSAKRSSLSGRVTLAGTQARIIASRRTFVNKRELEAREDRILKDLNTKRIKTNIGPKDLNGTPTTSFQTTALPFQQATADSSSCTGNKDNGQPITPSFTFPTAATGADIASTRTTQGTDSQNGLPLDVSSTFTETGKGKDTTDTAPISSSSGITFGTLAPSSESKIPSLSFNVPAPAPSSENVPETKSSKSERGAAPLPFQFGAPSQSSSSDAPATSTTTGFSFGSTSANTASSNNIPAGPPFQFGAPSPVPPSLEPAPGTGLSSFGSAPAASAAPAPTFQFGTVGPAVESQAPGTGFSFGIASTAKSEASTPAFQFENQGHAPASSGAPPAGTVFSFGSTSSTPSGPPAVTGVSFGSNQGSTMPAFNFDSTATTIPTGVGAVGGGGASARRRAKAKAGRRR